MSEFWLINLESKPIFDKYLLSDNIPQGDMSFTNCFMWMHARKIEYAIMEENLIIKTTYPSAVPYFFYPIGAGDKKASLLALQKYCKSENLALNFRALNAFQVRGLQEVFASQVCEIKLERDHFDYLYNVGELIALNGRKYHKKKNHLNAFLQEYGDFAYESLNEANLDEVKNVSNMWYEERARDSYDRGLYFENLGINQALQDFKQLGLKGGLIRIGKEIAAFSFGENIYANMQQGLEFVEASKLDHVDEQREIASNSSICLVHIEKANTAFRGIYQAINREVLLHEFSEFGLVNREEDLGIEGLRRAKLSYNPVCLLAKFSASIA